MKKSETKEMVTITVDGEKVQVPEGITVAAAVLGHTEHRHVCRNSVSNKPRSPYCMMGVCFECMMEIDGRPNQQSCVVTVREGMEVRRPSGPEEEK